MYYLITRVTFTLASVSNGWLFSSVNHTSRAWNSELNVFKKIWFFGEISNRLPNGLFRMYKGLLNLADNHYWQYYNELILHL